MPGDATRTLVEVLSMVGKYLMPAGAVLLVAGFFVWLLGRAGFRGLPGDIRWQSNAVKIYFPIVTCLVLSALLTLALWLWRWFSGR